MLVMGHQPNWRHLSIGLLLTVMSAISVADVSPPGQPSQSIRRDLPDDAVIERRAAVMAQERALWPDEVSLRRITPTLDRFFAGLQGASLTSDVIPMLFHPDFMGSGAPTLATSQHRETNGVMVESLAAPSERLDSESFAAVWTGYTGTYARISRTEYQIGSLSLSGHNRRSRQGASVSTQPATSMEAPEPPLSETATTARLGIQFRLTGATPHGLREDQGRADVVLVQQDVSSAWRLMDFSLTRLTRVTGSPQFQDQGARLNLPARDDIQASRFVSYFAEGVSLADFDNDGDLDLFLPQRVGAPIAYRNNGKGEFSDATAELGLDKIANVRMGYFFDWNNDGNLDLLLLTTTRMYLFQNGGGSFLDASGPSGFNRMQTTGLIGAAIADFDRDGLLDFYICSYGNPDYLTGFDYFDSRKGFFNKLFRNQGQGRFEDVTRRTGLDEDNRRWTFGALWLDFDQDDKTDLYVVNDFGPNQLFRNLGDGTFRDVAAEAGVLDYGNGMGASWADFNNDGLLDLYVSNMHSEAGHRILTSPHYPGSEDQRNRALRFAKGNTLLRNLGIGRFQEVDDTPVINGKWSWGSAFLDYDNDGDDDLYVANGMFSNNKRDDVSGTFWRHVLVPASAEDESWRTGSGYMNDLIERQAMSFAGYEHNRFFQNLGDGQFGDVGAVLAIDLVQDSRGVAVGDIDGDGGLDLAISNRNAPSLVVLKNQAARRGNYLAVKTRGTMSNRQGIGTRVTLTCDGVVQVKTVQLGTGFVSQSDQAVWFGLGQCAEVESLELAWPSGQVQRLSSVAVNQRIEVIEGL